MKKKLLFVFMSLCSVMMLSSFISFQNSYQDRIRISRTGGTTRATSDYEVEAFTDGKTSLNVSVTNYTGTAIVQIVGGRTSAQYYLDVEEMGYKVIAIGTLRPATYTIRVILDNVVYEGTFEKVFVGR